MRELTLERAEIQKVGVGVDIEIKNVTIRMRTSFCGRIKFDKINSVNKISIFLPGSDHKPVLMHPVH